MLGAIPLWLHILGATIWVGSQVMMFVVVTPSLRAAGDPGARYRVLRSVTRRFGYLGTASLVLLILTGIDNIDRYAPADMFDLRYGYILAVKLALLGVVLVLTVVHTRVIGPQLLAAQESQRTGDAAAAAIRSLRLRSIAVSSLTLLLSLIILFCAALLRTSFALQAA